MKAAELRGFARGYSERHLAPKLRDWESAGRVPAEALSHMAQAGLFGLMVSEAHGGTGVPFSAFVAAMEEFAAYGGAVSTLLHCHNLGTCSILERFGSEEQKERFLEPLAAGEKIGAFALTEPHTGSDASALKTKAVRSGNGYILSGTKQYISNGALAGICLVAARTGAENGNKGISLFLVPSDLAGFEVTRVERKLGQFASDTAEIHLADVEIPAANLLGTENDGYRNILAMLSDGRISVASQAIGFARAALEVALRYAQERTAFGRAIIEHQAVAFRLADMDKDIEIARAYVEKAARLVDQGRRCVREASIAKLFATEMAERVCSAAIQTLGGAGYTEEFEAARLYRDARVCQIYEGTSDMQRLLIARELAGGAGALLPDDA